MIALTTLYNGYIDRQKLTEKKNNWVYSSSPPLKWIGTIFKKIKKSFEVREQDETEGSQKISERDRRGHRGVYRNEYLDHSLAIRISEKG